MRTQLGTYYYPSTLMGQKAGSDVYEVTQQGFTVAAQSRGLQPDFWEAICSWSNANPDHPMFGDHGYLTQKEMVGLEGENIILYSRTNRNKLLFGWGLALEIKGTKQQISADSSIFTLAAYGLACVVDEDTTSGTYFGAFITPLSIEQNTAINEVVYGGDKHVNDDLSEIGSGNALFYSNLFDKFNSTAESELNQGIRAFANDTDVWSTVSQLLHASMRKVQSLPDGSIAAFYPDRWGKAGVETPIITIPQIELRSLKVDYVESNYYSHVYCNPVTIGGTGLAIRYSIGAVGIESDASALVGDAIANSTGENYRSKKMSALLKGFMSVPKDKEWQYSPDYLISRYGVRKKDVKADGVKVIQTSYETREENPQYILPFLIALYEFMDSWSQFKQVTLGITYNPFIWPGCRVEIEGMGLTVFVEKVKHSMNYESGFTTTITATAPMGSLVEGMVAQ